MGTKEIKKITPKARMKKLINNLRYAQLHVRLDLYGLKNSKEAVKRIAKEMRDVQKTLTINKTLDII